jgi:hypothetical protein
VSVARKDKERRRARRKEKAARPPKPRECDGCTACCTALAIPEVPSPAGEHCKHECEVGCAIYATRPGRCKADFKCLWLDGWGAKADDRPNQLGWLAYLDASFPQFNTVAGGASTKGVIVVARETVSGALQGTRFVEALRDWLERGSAVLAYESDEEGQEWMTLYGPRIPKGVRYARSELEALSGSKSPKPSSSG